MTDHRLEVADVVREHQEEFLAQWGHTVSPQQHKALRDIGACRAPVLGGHLEQCDQCGHSVIACDSYIARSVSSGRGRGGLMNGPRSFFRRPIFTWSLRYLRSWRAEKRTRGRRIAVLPLRSQCRLVAFGRAHPQCDHRAMALPESYLTARPKRLRFLIFNPAGRILHHARRIVCRIAGLGWRDWIRLMPLPTG